MRLFPKEIMETLFWFVLGLVIGGLLFYAGWIFTALSLERRVSRLADKMAELDRRLKELESVVPMTPEERRW